MKSMARFLSLLVGLLVAVSMATAKGWKGQTSANSNANAASVNKVPSTRKRRMSNSADQARAKTVTGPCDPNRHRAADLSGTYKGIVKYPDGGLSGEATLTITGNQFFLVAGNAAQTGRITAVTTCSYTAATMMFGELKKTAPGQPAPPPLPVISLRVTKKATDVILTPVPGERRTFSFAPNTGK